MKKAMPLIIGLLVVLGLGYLIWWDIQNPTISFLTAFVMGQIPSAIGVILTGWRSYSLARGKVPFSTLLSANGLALVASIFIPARLGDLAKPLYFKKMCDLPQAEGLAIVVKERVWDIVGLAALCALVPVLVKDAPFADQIASAIPLIIGLGFLAFAGMLALPHIIKSVSWLRRFDVYADAMRQGTWGGNAVHLLLSGAIWLSSLGIFYVFYNTSGLPELSLFQVLMVFLVATLGLVVTITPGGLGTYEAATVAVLTQFGVNWEGALAFAIGSRLCWMAIPIALGLVAILNGGDALLQRQSDKS